jgi:hypothetical protein
MQRKSGSSGTIGATGDDGSAIDRLRHCIDSLGNSTDRPRRIACHYGAGRHVTGDDAASCHDGARPDRDAAENDALAPDPDIVPDVNRTVTQGDVDRLSRGYDMTKLCMPLGRIERVSVIVHDGDMMGNQNPVSYIDTRAGPNPGLFPDIAP